MRTTRWGETFQKLELEHLFSTESLINLGWSPVPAIKGQGCGTWGQICIRAKKGGLITEHFNDWSDTPIVIHKQEKFNINTECCHKLSSMGSRLQFVLNVRKNFLIPKIHLYGRITRHDEKCSIKSAAYSFNRERLVKMQSSGVIITN